MQDKSKNELKAIATEMGLAFTNRATKTDLIDLIKTGTVPAVEPIKQEAVTQEQETVVQEQETVVQEQVEPEAIQEVAKVKSTTKPKLKVCSGNHSSYEDNAHNFPSTFGGRYSREFLISKRRIKE